MSMQYTDWERGLLHTFRFCLRTRWIVRALVALVVFYVLGRLILWCNTAMMIRGGGPAASASNHPTGAVAAPPLAPPRAIFCGSGAAMRHHPLEPRTFAEHADAFCETPALGNNVADRHRTEQVCRIQLERMSVRSLGIRGGSRAIR